MQRASLHLTEQQLSWLSREAKKLGITVAELVRRILDAARDSK